MSRKLLLRVSAFLTLFTFVGHTIGALSSPKDAPEDVLRVYESMHYAMVNFPFGSPKSIFTILYGANISLSFHLLVAGLIFVFLSSGSTISSSEKKILMVNSLGMIAIGIISVFCFFPLPAACLGIAGILGFVSLTRK